MNAAIFQSEWISFSDDAFGLLVKHDDSAGYIENAGQFMGNDDHGGSGAAVDVQD